MGPGRLLKRGCLSIFILRKCSKYVMGTLGYKAIVDFAGDEACFERHIRKTSGQGLPHT